MLEFLYIYGNGSSMYEGTLLHEHIFARRGTFVRRHFCTKTLLHEGSFLHVSKKKKK